MRCDRLLGNPRTSDEVRRRVEAVRVEFDLVQLLAEIRSGQQALVAIADGTIALPVDTPAVPILVADFLAGLRTAWRIGDVRPTAQPTLKPKRGRRRPGPPRRDRRRSAVLVRSGPCADRERITPAPPDLRSRPLPGRTAPHGAAPSQDLAQRDRVSASVRHPEPNNGGGGALGNICVRQPARSSGALLNEATRVTILIAVLQLRLEQAHRSAQAHQVHWTARLSTCVLINERRYKFLNLDECYNACRRAVIY